MNEQDRHLVRHLAKHFGTQRFSLDEAVKTASDGTADDGGKGERARGM